MEFLCKLAGNPEKCAPSIHVAGSKGKGSVISMLTSILTAAGFRTARYMSPHVIDVRERICLGNNYFSEEVYCSAGNELRELAEKKLPAAGNLLFDELSPDGCEPTYFELLTLFFFLCAKHGKCDVMAAETGMGGRLDSTNVLDPLVSVITLIELEHTAFLGDTIAVIAAEKAGIVKQGKPVILAKQCGEALEVFKKTAKEKDSPLVYFPDIAEVLEININSCGTKFSFNISVPAPLSETFFLPIPGKVQAENAALAITALRTAFPDISEDAIRSGLANLKIPARFEKISDTPPFIIDGAHTPESLELCMETFCSLYKEGGILIFGCAADKDASAMAKIAYNRFSKIIITSIGTFKTNDPKKVYEAFTEYEKEKVELITDIPEAVKQAAKFGQENGLPILGAGSFYLVSEIRRIFVG
ncbi:MAG: bifunctional folylpolyglutamate synthase/dihydrofolate synthase [Treponema sp.]|jgi:dihydrofolate synthase/folylpolyglutamate synthase|nr:bifunctional folylpolyglutamate synthase/dihydrofolate synthase [Treponema sp.]